MKRNDCTLSRIWKSVKEHDSGTISAYRSSEGFTVDKPLISKQMNKARNKELKSKLLILGYGITEIDGVYVEGFGTSDAVEVKEITFIVIDLKDKGNLKQDLIKLGTNYNQDSITFSKASGEYYTIHTNKCKCFPGFGKIGYEHKLDEPIFGKDGKFYSKIKGRPFIFKESLYKGEIRKLSDFYPTEIRGIKAASEGFEIKKLKKQGVLK